MEPRVADAERAGHRAGDSLLERGDAFGRHDPADVVGARLAQHLDGRADVVVGEQRVPIDPDDDFVLRGPDRGVEGRGRGTTRIGH